MKSILENTQKYSVVKFFTFFILMITLISCSQEEKELQKNNTNVYTKAAGDDFMYIVNCVGSCNNDAVECSKMIKNNVASFYQCPCESDACYAEVVVINPNTQEEEVLDREASGALLINLAAENKLFVNEMEVHLADTYTSYRPKIIGYKIFEDGENDFIQYSFALSSGEVETVAFMYNAATIKKYKVQCNGHCDTEQYKCTENMNFGTGSLNCACQSDNCYMVVEELTVGPTGG